MQHEPERIEIVYNVRYYDPIRKKRFTTSYKMDEKTAKERYGEYPEFEIIESSREERRIGGDPSRLSLSHFQRGPGGRGD